MLLAGCGAGATRVALAQQVEQRYWNDVAHLKTHDAYMLLTPGVRQAVKESDFYQNVLSLNESTSGVSAKVGKVTVVGNCAQAQLGLQAAKAPGSSYKVYQLLYWIDGGWHISEENGQVSRTYTPLTTCAG